MKTQQSNTINFGIARYGNPDMATTWCWHEKFKIPAFLMRTMMLAAFLLFISGTAMAQPGIGTGGTITQLNINGTWYVVHT